MQDANSKKLDEKLIELLRETMTHDNSLREKYKVETKFGFIAKTLQTLLDDIENQLSEKETINKKEEFELGKDESFVYVYLFNAKGMDVSSWQNMITTALLYEYSVNRPIYDNNKFISDFIKAKTNKNQQGYLTIAIKTTDILKQDSSKIKKDNLGNPLVKVKEGSLKLDRLLSLNHNGKEYVLNKDGVLAEKV